MMMSRNENDILSLLTCEKKKKNTDKFNKTFSFFSFNTKKARMCKKLKIKRRKTNYKSI